MVTKPTISFNVKEIVWSKTLKREIVERLFSDKKVTNLIKKGEHLDEYA